jgi:tyrosyl-tRNA synthetase
MRFKPVIISHHMLMGLKEGQEKMSKSDPDSAIFMEDAAEDVKRKVLTALSMLCFVIILILFRMRR